MVWDWRVSRAGPMPFYWPSCSLTFFLLLFSLSLLSFYGLVLWGWGLRTDRVLIALSPALHCQPFLIIIIIITLSTLCFDPEFPKLTWHNSESRNRDSVFTHGKPRIIAENVVGINWHKWKTTISPLRRVLDVGKYTLLLLYNNVNNARLGESD